MVLEYRPLWNAGTANPGYTVLHGRDSGLGTQQQAAEALSQRARTFFNSLAGILPDNVQITFPTEVIERDTSTGVLTGSYTVPAQAAVTGINASTFSWAAGVRVEWKTPAIVAGRRLRGRTFLVPAASNVFDTDGRITSANITALQNAANAYFSTGVFTNVQPAVWSTTHGILSDITSATVPVLGATMRSRRD
jgi:hypothetical protein